jgi:hypothetical protein
MGVGALFLGLLASLPSALVACDSSESGPGGAKDPSKFRNTAIQHEPCDVKGKRVEALDANNDGKPEVQRVYDGNREACRVSDLNGDGRPNMYEYFAPDGSTIRRREFDYDDNNIVNAIEVYEGGRLSHREMDTTNQGRIDTWDTFDLATGKIAKRERDSSLDGRVDQWWVWTGDVVQVAVDRDGDGNPDPEASIVIGANGQPFIDGGATKAAPSASASAVAPTPPPAPPPPAATTPELDSGAPPGPAKRGNKR